MNSSNIIALTTPNVIKIQTIGICFSAINAALRGFISTHNRLDLFSTAAFPPIQCLLVGVVMSKHYLLVTGLADVLNSLAGFPLMKGVER